MDNNYPGFAIVSSKTYFAVAPGCTLKEQLEYRDMTQQDLAERMDVSEDLVSELIHGTAELTEPIAVKLESVLGISKKFWMNLEADYRDDLVKVREENEREAGNPA